MQSSLLTTKLYFPPPRPGLVPRRQLVDRLQGGLSGPLTLISAPAGSGKTTLLSEWRTGPGAKTPVAWLSLDTADNNSLRFFQYLCATLDLIQPGLQQHLHPLLIDPDTPPPEAILTIIINTFSAYPQDCVLALDDYHLIENQIIHQSLSFLLDHLPPRMHLVLLTRSDPPLPLARLRARGQLTEIRSADLRFSIDEAEIFLNHVMGLSLTPAEAAVLGQRTEGWIAGLQLAALSIQGRENTAGFIAAFSGSHQHIVDYLIEEVLVRQPDAVQTFLLQTSILDRLTGDLCDAVTGLSGNDAILQRLAQANLFLIPLDDERRWYRYHHLFADLLYNRLHKYASEQVPLLHQRAAAWYDRCQMTIPAVEHSFAAQDYPEARRLMRKYFPGWMRTENTLRIEQWFEKFPKEFLHAEPWLCMVHAWMVWRQGNAKETERCIQIAQNALIKMQATGQFPHNDPEYTGIQSEIYAFQGLVASQTNDPQGAIEKAQQALDAAPEDAPVVRAIAHMVMTAIYRNRGELDKAQTYCEAGLPEALIAGETGTIVSVYQNLGGILFNQGLLRKAAEVYQQALAYAESRDQAHYPSYGMIRMRLADLHYYWNQLDEAENLLRTGLECVDFASNWWGMIYGRYLLGLIQSARGENQALEQTYQEITQIMPKITGAYYANELNTLLILVRAKLGLKPDTSPEKVLIPIRQDAEPDTSQYERLMMQTKARFALNTQEDTIDQLVWLEEIATRRGYVLWLIEVLVLKVIAWQTQGNYKEAESDLLKVLNLAEPNSIIRPFLDGGKPVCELLRKANAQLMRVEIQRFSRHILDAFNTTTPQPPKQRQPALLSNREIELLGLVAAGLSNKEIARELYISIGTVKRHTVNIFNKLDVKNRTEAVARARDLDLL